MANEVHSKITMQRSTVLSTVLDGISILQIMQHLNPIKSHR